MLISFEMLVIVFHSNIRKVYVCMYMYATVCCTLYVSESW